jgi:hypothetical protein
MKTNPVQEGLKGKRKKHVIACEHGANTNENTAHAFWLNIVVPEIRTLAKGSLYFFILIFARSRNRQCLVRIEIAATANTKGFDVTIPT